MMKARRRAHDPSGNFAPQKSALDDGLRDIQIFPRNCNGFIQKSAIKMLVRRGDSH